MAIAILIEKYSTKLSHLWKLNSKTTNGLFGLRKSKVDLAQN